uniref:Uncharacterized protein n=1 Tax=Oryza nivara TaxID=4536 RepID=A0A0E0HMT9_ORYNI
MGLVLRASQPKAPPSPPPLSPHGHRRRPDAFRRRGFRRGRLGGAEGEGDGTDKADEGDQAEEAVVDPKSRMPRAPSSASPARWSSTGELPALNVAIPRLSLDNLAEVGKCNELREGLKEVCSWAVAAEINTKLKKTLGVNMIHKFHFQSKSPKIFADVCNRTNANHVTMHSWLGTHVFCDRSPEKIRCLRPACRAARRSLGRQILTSRAAEGALATNRNPKEQRGLGAHGLPSRTTLF